MKPLAKIESVFKKYNPEQPLNTNLPMKNTPKNSVMKSVSASWQASFAILAIFISCLGLFGMASFMASNDKRNRRAKSIGRFCIQSLAIVIERFCAACFYFIAYCFAACILFHA